MSKSIVQNLRNYSTPKGFRGRSKFVVQLWWITESTLFACSPQIFYGWRRFLLRLFGAKIGKGVLIRPSVRITYPWKLIIGDYSWIGDDVNLYSLGRITIGDNSVISQRSYLCTGSHDYRITSFDIYSKDISIGPQCWLASDVFVHPGITIGEGAVVGARSTVTTDLENFSVYSGSPALFIKPRKD